MNYDEARALLEQPGGMFEVVEEPVQGRPTTVFKQRERSMREKVANAVGAHGDKEFLVDGEERLTYRGFGELCWGSGHTLIEEHGLQKGDRIAILSYNRPEWLVTLFGATSAGAIAVGLNGFWAAEEIEYGLRDSGSRFLIVDELLYSRVAPLLGRIDTLEEVFYIGDDAPEGTTPIDALLQPRATPPETPIDEDDPFVILYTSGTTGRSKGCITTHRGTVAQVQGIIHNFLVGALTRGENPLDNGSGAEPATLLTSPLFHVAGLHSTVCTSMTAGTRLVFGPPKFDAEQVLGIIDRERISTWMAIPTLLSRLLEHPKLPDHDLSTLQSISTGGAPASSEMLQKARSILPKKPNAGTTYGLTECHGMATSISGAEIESKKGSVGRPIPIMQLKIVDADGAEVPQGVSGEICLRGATITPGYWNRPDATAETVRDGWLHTGDIGYLDEDGYLFISDRAKDMILRGGENVYCVEIENVISDHPEIEEAAVVGVPDKDMGERVKAIVKRNRDSDIDELRVQAHVAEHLAKFKVPEIIVFTEQPLPRNPAGKLLKNELRGEEKSRFTP
ncbi:MAG: class I adenylate-forming enzyme family protein [Myxococcales bacterium]|nr:class I adenylate-forming enzyme family protein [Myxococcales bacterium]